MDDEVPDSMARAQLLMAGLGEKKISLIFYGSADQVHDELFDNYPKLANGGGYELLRQGVSKQLDVISVPQGGYTVEYISSVVHGAKVYIRLLQKTLDMTNSCDVSMFQLFQ